MLIEFSVGNFRSFRERQTLSMVAFPRMQRKNNVFTPKVEGEKLPPLLKVAVIYGPNASGKSNLLKALDVAYRIANRRPSIADALLPVAPFAFDPTLADRPSEFEYHFIFKGTRYQFNLAVTTDRIHAETLVGYPQGKKELFYSRVFNGESEQYEFGLPLRREASEAVLETWKKLTPSKLLFIAQAVANSSAEIEKLKAPFEWISGGIFTVLHGMAAMSKAAQELIEEDERIGEDVASFLREVDVPITNIKSVSVARPSVALGSGEISLAQALGGRANEEKKRVKTTLTHESSLGSAELAYEDESEGTKNLMGFWMPWFTRNSRHHPRCVLIIDELDSSLHPKIVESLVDMHIKDESPSQLIFTTHDTHLMDTKLLRRDQIWITERDREGATQLRSVHDFAGRESEDVEKRYYEGRYRGLPILSKV